MRRFPIPAFQTCFKLGGPALILAWESGLRSRELRQIHLGGLPECQREPYMLGRCGASVDAFVVLERLPCSEHLEPGGFYVLP